jgi:hypothetical protein
MRIWADIDLAGVRIARLLYRWSSETAQPIWMGPEDFEGAATSRPLSARGVAAIRADIKAHPDGLLRDTLEAILKVGRWVEQEALLPAIEKPPGSKKPAS